MPTRRSFGTAKGFIANSPDLLKMARKHSKTYKHLAEKDKSVIDFWLMEEIFSVTYDDGE